jgi:hypothetical protein
VHIQNRMHVTYYVSPCKGKAAVITKRSEVVVGRAVEVIQSLQFSVILLHVVYLIPYGFMFPGKWKFEQIQPLALECCCCGHLTIALHKTRSGESKATYSS